MSKVILKNAAVSPSTLSELSLHDYGCTDRGSSVLPECWFASDALCDIMIDNGTISAIGKSGTLPCSGAEEVDCAGLAALPGFIDLQVNGCGGVTFNDAPCVDTLMTMLRTNEKSGTATFLPTLVTCEDEKIVQALEAVRAFKKEFGPGASSRIPGIHLEGPFISLAKSGIHDQSHIRRLSDRFLKVLLEHKDDLALVTLSPDAAEKEHTEALHKAGVVVSIGHTAVEYEEASDYLPSGYTCATHLGNAMTRAKNARTPGALEAVLEANLYSGVIADGCHAHPGLVKIWHRLLGDRLFLVTDALAPAGCDEEMADFMFCGKKMNPRQGKFCADSAGTLGGSLLTMDKGIENLITLCGYTPCEAVAAATKVPAAVLASSGRTAAKDLGCLKQGAPAHIAICDRMMKVKKIIV